MQMHGGDVTVSSVAGEGSIFRLTLPVAEAVAKEAVSTRPEPIKIVPEDIDNPLILIIDDEQESTDIIDSHLKSAG